MHRFSAETEVSGSVYCNGWRLAWARMVSVCFCCRNRLPARKAYHALSDTIPMESNKMACAFGVKLHNMFINCIVSIGHDVQGFMM